MRILILSQYWHPENGVAQRRWSWLSGILDAAGHDVVVVAPQPRGVDAPQGKSRVAGGEKGPSGETIIRCPSLPTGTSLTMRALNQAYVSASQLILGAGLDGGMRRYPPDVIIGTVPALPVAWTTMFVARLRNVPYVIDLRDAWPALLRERESWNDTTGVRSLRERILSRGPIQLVSRLVERLLYASYRHSDGMIFTSRRLLDEIRANPRVSRGTAHQPMVTIRNVFPVGPPQARTRRAHVGQGELNVLYAGTMGRAQKLSNVLDAVKIAREQGTPVNVRMVGAGAARAALKERIDRDGLPVALYGKIPASELAAHYEWADSALVHLRDWAPLASAIPSKTYELMGLGIHISAAVSGEPADLIRDLGAGDVVAPEDPRALAELWAELARDRERLIPQKEAAEWVRRERNKESAGKLLALLDQVASAKWT